MQSIFEKLRLKNSNFKYWQPPSTANNSNRPKPVTHWGIGAHQDDVEIIGSKGILQALHNPQGNIVFGAIVASDGRGSSRTGKYQAFSDEQMMEIRASEQEKAAAKGHYQHLLQLGYSSQTIKDPLSNALEQDLIAIFESSGAAPEVIYCHNLADKHDTHVALTLKLIKALRKLPNKLRPKQLLGCEVWRGLDWLDDNQKILLDISGGEELIADLINCHDSQTSGGKRYDLAVAGRMRANATFFQANNADGATHIWYAMDLTPLVINETQDIEDYIVSHIDQFKCDVINRLRQLSPKA